MVCSANHVLQQLKLQLIWKQKPFLCFLSFIRDFNLDHLVSYLVFQLPFHLHCIEMVKGREYERVFLYFDENGDGKISPSELHNRMGLMGGDVLLKEVEVAMESLDRDGDGLLDLEDFVGLIEGGSEEEKLKDLKEAFGLYDVDNCGFITPQDLRKMLGRLGESKSIDECELMISQFDLNGDGVLSFEEFRVMMQ